jgi:transcriptional regulator with XRE-family HTH domain/predicted RNase H-like HicB family nuclease
VRYDAIVTREDHRTLVVFPDCAGCQTFADSDEDALPSAREALEGWLEAHLAEGLVPPRPRERKPPRQGTLLPVTIAAKLAAVLQVRWARSDLGWSQGRLAKEVGVSQQAIAKFEHPDSNVTLDTLSKVAAAMGYEVSLTLDRLEGVEPSAAFDVDGAFGSNAGAAPAERSDLERILDRLETDDPRKVIIEVRATRRPPRQATKRTRRPAREGGSPKKCAENRNTEILCARHANVCVPIDDALRRALIDAGATVK